jgi:hypothetical protein
MGNAMHIHGPLNKPNVPPQNIDRTGRTNNSSVRRVADPDVDTSRIEAVTTESARLVEALRELPDVRVGKIHEIAERLAKGDYLSKEEALKTAEAISETELFFDF